MQIDVKSFDTIRDTVSCNLLTGSRCVTIIMARSDYEALIRDGFFIRDGKKKDSAGVLNTTLTYELPEKKEA